MLCVFQLPLSYLFFGEYRNGFAPPTLPNAQYPTCALSVWVFYVRQASIKYVTCMYVGMPFYAVHYRSNLMKAHHYHRVIRCPVLVWRRWVLLYLYLSERLTDRCGGSLLVGVGRGALVDWFGNGRSWFCSPDVLPDGRPRGGDQLCSNSHPSAQAPGLSGGIEVVAGSMFRLFAFSLANHVLVHIQ